MCERESPTSIRVYLCCCRSNCCWRMLSSLCSECETLHALIQPAYLRIYQALIGSQATTIGYRHLSIIRYSQPTYMQRATIRVGLCVLLRLSVPGRITASHSFCTIVLLGEFLYVGPCCSLLHMSYGTYVPVELW